MGLDKMDIIPAQDTPDYDTDPTTLPPIPLPAGVSSRFVKTDVLNFHILESVPELPSGAARPPLVLCVHGFPELAYSWRYVLPQLAAAGYYAVAFDQRGYGRTHSPDRKSIPGHTFRPLSLIKDAITLVYALGYTQIHTLVGHDFGAVTATFLTLARGSTVPPDLVKSLVLMSHPYKGVPHIPFNSAPNSSLPSPSKAITPTPSPYQKLHDTDIHTHLAELAKPRKHYKWYYCTRPSADEMTHPVGQPMHDFMRGYFHLKSADWNKNVPHPLSSWTADQLEKMPHYYIMPLHKNMREAVEQDMHDQPRSSYGQRWLSDADLDIYCAEYARNGFGPAMNWYRVQTNPEAASDVHVFAGRKLSVPMKFIAGAADWGTYQEPGAVEAMETTEPWGSVEKGCYLGTVLVESAGHWVNQEQPEACVKEIVDLARRVSSEN